MQPDPQTQLAGLRRILEQVVRPAVGDAFAALQLRAVEESLDQLAAWLPRRIELLEREHAELRALFAEAAGSPLVGAALRARLGDAAREAPLPGSALPESTRALRAQACELIAALARAPAGAERDALRGRVRRALRANLERALET